MVTHFKQVDVIEKPDVIQDFKLGISPDITQPEQIEHLSTQAQIWMQVKLTARMLSNAEKFEVRDIQADDLDGMDLSDKFIYCDRLSYIWIIGNPTVDPLKVMASRDIRMEGTVLVMDSLPYPYVHYSVNMSPRDELPENVAAQLNLSAKYDIETTGRKYKVTFPERYQ